MQWDILATILLTASIQSVFGVGVVLFGTPMLVVLGIVGALVLVAVIYPGAAPFIYPLM